MAYDVTHKTNFNSAADQVTSSAASLLEKLGGKTSDKSNPAKGQLEATFNKQIGGRTLMNRVTMRVKVVPEAGGGSTVMAKAFPVDPLGNKLSFGVQGNATQIVVDTFFEQLGASVGG